MAEQYKRRRGDRRDGRLLWSWIPLHYITGIIYPNRCDNEAYIGLRVDLTPINEYLKKKNEGEEVFPYTMFHIITAALIKTITLRPKLNRFIANCNFYQRNEVTASFIVKKKFSDNGGESLAFIHAKDEETVDTLHEQLFKKIMNCRSEETGDSTEGAMDILNKMPAGFPKRRSRPSAGWTATAGCPKAWWKATPIIPRWCFQSRLHWAEVRLPPSDQLGHLLAVLHCGRKEDGALLYR